jgi:hypothetical protein
MLLGPPWLQDVKVTHNGGNNFIRFEGNGIIRTLAITKHLDNNTKHKNFCSAMILLNGVTV